MRPVWRTAQWWRVTVAGVTLSLLGLAASTGWSAYLAHQNASRAEAEAQRARAAEEHARAELRNSVGLRLRAEAAAMFAGLRPEPDERAMQQLLAALRLAGNSRQARQVAAAKQHVGDGAGGREIRERIAQAQAVIDGGDP